MIVITSVKEVQRHSENNDPLYCFKLNSNGTLTKIKIREWIMRTWSGYSLRCSISFDNKKYPINNYDKWYSFDNTKLERFVSDKVFTFNGNENQIKNLILANLESKMIDAKKLYNSYKATYDSII